MQPFLNIIKYSYDYKELGLQVTTFLKTKALKVGTFLATFFSPVAFVFLVVGMAVVADTLAGRWAAKNYAKTNGIPTREYVTSRLTRKGMMGKFWAYLGLVAAIYVFDYYLVNAFVNYLLPSLELKYALTKSLGFILVLVELDSIDEKYYRVKGIRIADKIKRITKKIKGLILDTSKTIGDAKNKINNKKDDNENAEG